MKTGLFMRMAMIVLAVLCVSPRVSAQYFVAYESDGQCYQVYVPAPGNERYFGAEFMGLSDDASSRTEVVIPTTISYEGRLIPVSAVRGLGNCTNVTTFYVNDSNQELAYYKGLFTLSNVPKLTSLYIGRPVDTVDATSYDVAPFKSLKYITKIGVGASITVMDESLTTANDSKLECIYIAAGKTPLKVTSKGLGAQFGNLLSLKTLYMGRQIEGEGIYLNYSLTTCARALETLIIGASVTDFPAKSLTQCSPEYVCLTSIPDYLNITFSDESGYFGGAGSNFDTDYDMYYGTVSDFNFRNVETVRNRMKLLTTLTVNPSCGEVKENAFNCCASLKTVKIGGTTESSATKVCYHAFSYCSSLTTVEIYPSVKTVEQSAFFGSDAIKTLTIDDCETALTIGDYNFVDAPLTNLYLGRDLYYTTSPFRMKDERISLTVGDPVKSIGNGLFEGSNFSTIKFGSGQPDGDLSGISLTRIGMKAFYISILPSTLALPLSVTTIGAAAFYNCNDIVEVSIPQRVTSIGLGAFDRCSGLATVNCTATVPPAAVDAFMESTTQTATLHVPAGALDAYKTTEPWSDFLNIVDDLEPLADPALRFSSESVSLEMGAFDQSQLPVLENPLDVEVTYSSSNTSVATVSADGVVSPRSEGVTTITARTPQTEAHVASTASYELTLWRKVLKDPGLKFSIDELFIDPDKEFTEPVLTKDTPAEVTYTSSDESVVTVAPDGKLTVVGPGEAFIKASVEATEDYKAGYADYFVMVGSRELKNPGLKFSAMTLIIEPGKEFTEPTLIKSTPAEPTYSSSNESVVTVAPDGKLTVVGSGMATITASVSFTAEYAAGQTSYTVIVRGKDLKDPGLKFSTTSLTAVLGQPFTPPVLTKETDATVKYASSDVGVASVSSSTGAITITGVGHVVITATTEATDEYSAGSASYSIDVEKQALLDPDLKFSETGLVYTLGDTFTAPTLTKATTAVPTYTSSNLGVAEVDATTGDVTFHQSGWVTITARVEATDIYRDGEASYTIRVNNPFSGEYDDGVFIYYLYGEERRAELTGIVDKSSMAVAVIPGTVKCEGLEYTVDEIRGQVFQNMTNLRTVVLPESLKTVGAYEFSGCKSLSSINLENVDTRIGYSAFESCAALTEVTLSDKLPLIESYTFSKTGVTHVRIGDSVSEIETAAFYCGSLESVELPASLKSIGLMAFCGNSGLSSITVHAVEPPVTNIPFDTSIYTTCKLTVPEESLEAYMDAAVWKEFLTIASADFVTTGAPYSVNGGELTFAPGLKGDVAIFTVSGAVVYKGEARPLTLVPGCYIISAAGRINKQIIK